MFNILLSVQILLSMLLGGRGTLFGPVLGAFLIEPLNEFANNNLGGGNARLLVFGGLMALVVMFLPRGIIPTRARRCSRRGARAARPGWSARGSSCASARASAPRGRALQRPASRCSRSRGWRSASAALQAVDGASFVVPEGSITALIGPNGSGKTTVFNLIGGTMRAERRRGLVRRAADRRAAAVAARLRRARAHVPDHAAVPRDDRARERRRAAARRSAGGQLNADGVSGAEAERAEELLDVRRDEALRRRSRRGALSYGQQKLVELAQVLMLDPKLILLDEPAGGINPTLIERMGEMIRELNRAGTTFLIVEHNMPFVLGLCDPVLVLARGKTIARGRAGARSSATRRCSTPTSATTSCSRSRRWSADAAPARAA